jgi:hypothetical protein
MAASPSEGGPWPGLLEEEEEKARMRERRELKEAYLEQ